MVELQKCAVIGCGFVGAATAFALTKSGLFSEMVLIDANRDKAQGEAMDLSHGVPFTRPVRVYAGDYQDVASCGLVIITAGANQAPDETRLDLISKNYRIMQSIIPQVVENNKECILLIVSNPVDVLTLAAQKISGFPPERVIGSGTVLDTSRLKYLLGIHLGVDSRNVHAFIIGEHGDSELPVWSSANVSGVDLDSFCESCGKCGDMQCMREIFEQVRDSAYKVIEKKGATYYAIALAVLRIAQAIVRDERSVLPVSSLIGKEYGPALEGLCLGMPAIVGREGILHQLRIPLNEEEKENLIRCANTIRTAAQQIGLV